MNQASVAGPSEALGSSSDPSISVVLSTYNGERWLEPQLESLIRQSNLPGEVVIRDDGSTDGTMNLLKTFIATANFPVRLLGDDDGNLGVIRSFERVIGAAQGEIIALCDQDDVWHPDKLEKIAQSFMANPSAAYFFSDAALVDEDGTPMGRNAWQIVGLTDAIAERVRSGTAFELLRNYPMVTGATLAFRSSLRRQLLPFPKLLETARDPAWHLHDGWVAIVGAAQGPGIAVPQALIDYRIHAGQAAGLPLDGAPSMETLENGLKTYEIDARNLAPVVERLSLFPETEGMGRHLSDKLDHITHRIQLIYGPKYRRPDRVAREVASGRYRSHSRGWKSALKDLITQEGGHG